MSTISTFSGFTMARLGIMASQKALEVTGNNISNINTPGYTRQALDQRALYIGGGDRYASQFDVRVGAGALATGVSQLRDPYLDIRYRNENANVGFYSSKVGILDQLSAIFDEVGKGEEDNGVIEAQLSRLLESLQSMNTEHAGDQSYDAMVRQTAKSLVSYFNTYANKLETLYADTQKEFKADLGEINNILDKIRNLNESIKKSEISSGALSEAERKEGMIGERGQQALELRDERNQLIDELSSYLPIDVKYSDEPIGGGMTVEKLTITLTGRSDVVLVDGIYGGHVSVQQVQQTDGAGNPITGLDGKPVMVEDPYLKLEVSALYDKRGEKIRDGKPGDTPKQLGDQDLVSGSLQATREMLTKNGEFSSVNEVDNMDSKAATKRGIPYYQKVLDALANKIAQVFNEANTTDKDKNPITNADITGAGVLFSNSGDGDDTTGITAKNISISHSWAHEQVHIIQTRDPANNGLSTANDNIAHLISLMQQDFEFKPSDIYTPPGGALKSDAVYFKGTFHGMLGYINGVLGEDTKSSGDILDNYFQMALDLDLSRDSVSGVDLNDEALNMMQFQKSYSASCRLLTTLDEILDKLINGTGLAGR